VNGITVRVMVWTTYGVHRTLCHTLSRRSACSPHHATCIAGSHTRSQQSTFCPCQLSFHISLLLMHPVIALGPCADDYDEEGLITPTAYCMAAAEWVEAGASIVGGCCGVGPEHMLALRQRLQPRRPPPAANGAVAAEGLRKGESLAIAPLAP
jgi:hypothetical protein